MKGIRGGTVVDADGAREADVAVADGEIVAVGDDVVDADEAGNVASVDDRAHGDADVLDADGLYVAPGLVDAHVHVFMDGGPDPTASLQSSRSAKAYRATRNLREMVAAGVAAVRDLGAPESLAIDAGAAVADGTIAGPRVLAAGENVVMTGGHGHWFGREADGPAEVRKAAREQMKRGADVVKCMATGGVLTEGAVTGAPELTEAELSALVDAAHSQGVPTAAHAHGVEGIKNAVRAGIDSIEHGTFMDREAAEMMAERGTYWVPTAKALHGIVEQGVEAGIPEYAVRKAEDAADAFDDAFDHAIEAGVPVAMGTDAGTPFNFHADAPEELALMVDHGLSAAAAMEAATVGGADLLGLDDAGRVAEGHRADLVVLGEDPRSDPAAWQDPVAVVRAGDVVAGREA